MSDRVHSVDPLIQEQTHFHGLEMIKILWEKIKQFRLIQDFRDLSEVP